MRGVLACKVIKKSRAALASIYWMQGRMRVSAAGLLTVRDVKYEASYNLQSVTILAMPVAGWHSQVLLYFLGHKMCSV